MTDPAIIARPINDIDIDLLNQALDQIAADPASWDQSMWRCGTTMCLAGHVAILAGAVWERPEVETNSTVVTPLGFMSVSSFARLSLGINIVSAAILFQGGNTLHDLRSMAERLATHGTLTAWEPAPCACLDCERHMLRSAITADAVLDEERASN